MRGCMQCARQLVHLRTWWYVHGAALTLTLTLSRSDAKHVCALRSVIPQRPFLRVFALENTADPLPPKPSTNAAYSSYP